VTSYSVVKRNNLWHLLALQSQGDRVLQEKLIVSLPSLEQAYFELEVYAKFDFCHGQAAFPG
jgi:hypothetical protein